MLDFRPCPKESREFPFPTHDLFKRFPSERRNLEVALHRPPPSKDRQHTVVFSALCVLGWRYYNHLFACLLSVHNTSPPPPLSPPSPLFSESISLPFFDPLPSMHFQTGLAPEQSEMKRLEGRGEEGGGEAVRRRRLWKGEGRPPSFLSLEEGCSWKTLPSLHSSFPFLLPPRERGKKVHAAAAPLCLFACVRAGDLVLHSKPAEEEEEGRKRRRRPAAATISITVVVCLCRRVWSFARQSDVSRSCKRTRLGADTAKQIRYT